MRKIACNYFRNSSASGDEVPQTSYRGSAPGSRWETPVPQTPCGSPPISNLLPPHLLSKAIEWTVKCYRLLIR